MQVFEHYDFPTINTFRIQVLEHLDLPEKTLKKLGLGQQAKSSTGVDYMSSTGVDYSIF